MGFRSALRGRPFVAMALCILLTGVCVVPLQRMYADKSTKRLNWVPFLWLVNYLTDHAWLFFVLFPYRLIFSDLSTADWAALNKSFNRYNFLSHSAYLSVCFMTRFLLLFYEPREGEAPQETYRLSVVVYITTWSVTLFLIVPLTMGYLSTRENAKKRGEAQQRRQARQDFAERIQNEQPGVVIDVTEIQEVEQAVSPTSRMGVFIGGEAVLACAVLSLFTIAEAYPTTVASTLRVVGDVIAAVAILTFSFGLAGILYTDNRKDMTHSSGYVHACIVVGALAYRAVAAFGSFFLRALRVGEGEQKEVMVAAAAVAFSVVVHVILAFFEKVLLARTFQPGNVCVLLFLVQFLENMYHGLAVLNCSIDNFSFWVILTITAMKNFVRNTDAVWRAGASVASRLGLVQILPVEEEEAYAATTAVAMWTHRVRAQQASLCGVVSTFLIATMLSIHEFMAHRGAGFCNLDVSARSEDKVHCVAPENAAVVSLYYILLLLMHCVSAVLIRWYWLRRDTAAAKRSIGAELMMLVTVPDDAVAVEDEEAAAETPSVVGRDIWHYWNQNYVYFSSIACFAIVFLFSVPTNPSAYVGTT